MIEFYNECYLIKKKLPPAFTDELWLKGTVHEFFKTSQDLAK